MNEYITDTQFCKMVGISKKTSYKWREAGKGPVFYRFEGHTIRYKLYDVNRWIERQRGNITPKPA